MMVSTHNLNAVDHQSVQNIDRETLCLDGRCNGRLTRPKWKRFQDSNAKNIKSPANIEKIAVVIL
jgi:hypothetical protein